MSFTCPICHATSHHPNDIEEGYCGACHAFTGACTLRPCPGSPTVVAGNIAFCTPHAEEAGLT